ncbi:MAG: uracil-DNA glycosylase [Alphaproteobacteria bacterium]
MIILAKIENSFSLRDMNENTMTLEQTVEWLMTAGVDETLGDEAYSLGAAQTEIKKVEARSSSSRETASSYLPQNTISACQDSRKICEESFSLEELKEKILIFEGCSIKQTASNTVFGQGSVQAKIMFIAEAPGTDEDRYGIPFAGNNAILLDKMIKAAGFKKSDCYFATILPWRPPGNRTPAESEISICLPFIKKQIELVSPQYIFLLGGSTANALLDISEPISKIRGKWLEYKVKNKTIDTITSFHPEYIFKNQEQKAKTWSDLLRIRKKFS